MEGYRRHALVHKSELASYRVENVSDAVDEGEVRSRQYRVTGSTA